MPRNRNENVTRILQEAAMDAYRSGKETFTINTFDHRGVSVKTFEHRILKSYDLVHTWEQQNSRQWKRVFRIIDLIDAMKKQGDWT